MTARSILYAPARVGATLPLHPLLLLVGRALAASRCPGCGRRTS
ncbi:MAG TPA: hypothetical protein VGW34_10590 [Allosphingosinicella sp.]|nr:hypothetical protein [Allosphingosinicella sp.]